MNAMRTKGWLLGGALVVALAFAAGCARRHPTVNLPPLVEHAGLPPAFQRALREAHEQASAQPRAPEPLRKLARLYQANRLFPEAKSCYAAIQAEPPGLSARDRYYLADLAENEGDLDRAVGQLLEVTRADPGYLPARAEFAEILFKLGQEQVAAEQYRAVVQASPHHPAATLGLARLALQHGDDATAISLLEQLLAAHPESTSGAGLLAQILQRRGEAERADALAQWSRQKHEPVPDDPWKESLLADCYDRQQLALKFEEYFFSGQLEKAAPLLARVEELDPDSWMPPLLRGFSQARIHQDADAIKQYQMALDRGGDPEKILPLLVASLLQLNRTSEAVAIAGDYAAKKPDSQPLLLAYADALIRLGDEAKTRPVLTKLLEQEPYLYTQNLALAKILWTAGERDAAAQCLRRVAQTFPNDVASRGLLAQYYLEKSDPVAAVGPLEQALAQTAAGTPARDRVTAMLTTAYFQIASAEAEKMHFTPAISYYDKITQLAPTEMAAYLGKANALVQLKQFPQAARTLEKMAALQPDNPTIFLSLGDVLYQTGDQAAARRHWEQAVQLAASADTELRAALYHRLHDPLTSEDFK